MKKVPRFRLIRTMVFTFGVLIKYKLLVWVLVLLPKKSHNPILGWFFVRQAKRLKKLCMRMRGLLIKAGQFMGVMGNLFDSRFAAELEQLQDNVTPVDFSEIAKRIQLEFGTAPEILFKTIERQPIASASLGQVHVAYTQAGAKVAVKVLYPGVESIVMKDLANLKLILSIIDNFFDHVDLKMIYTEFEQMVSKEIDYVQEAYNLETIKNNFKGDQRFIFPKVFYDYSGKTVLTTQFIEGFKINDLSHLEELNINKPNLMKNLTVAYCDMIFNHQFFHADPHSGNLFFVPGENGEARIAFIDFGAVEIFPDKLRNALQKFIRAFFQDDIKLMIESFKDGGFVTTLDDDKLESWIEVRYERMANLNISDYSKLNLQQMDRETKEDLKKAGLSLNEVIRMFQMPRNYLFFIRTLTMLQGLSSQLAPTISIFEIALPFLKRFVSRGTNKTKSWTNFFKNELFSIGKSLIKLPGKQEKTISQISKQGITTRNIRLEKGIERIYKLGHQFIYTLLGLAAFFTGVYFETYLQMFQRADIFYYTGLGFGVLLLISFFRNRKSK